MTRADVLADYTVDEHGIIRSPGKFEAEMIYVPMFWDAFLNGGADEDDGYTMTFEVNDHDRAEFPELADVVRVCLRESSDGFVYGEAVHRVAADPLTEFAAEDC